MLLEFFEFVLVKMISKGTLSAAEMATKNQEFIFASLVQKASVDWRFLTHWVWGVDCDPL